jgi:prolyl-tRNA editing enzyme YbaK/EbsC (Cys-tRNA(Pro) deacylase)
VSVSHSESANDDSQDAHQAAMAWLDSRGVPYVVSRHPKTFAALDEAVASGVDPRETLKTLVLSDRGQHMLAVVPASHHLDISRVRAVLEASPNLRLASETEIARDFPAFELGAIPPFGPMLPAPEVVDVRILYRDRVLCSGGDHIHALVIDPRDLIRVTEPRVADICEHGHLSHEHDFESLPHV